MTDEVHSYRARWVIPVVGPPIANGIVVVHRDRIVGIHRSRRAGTIDLGEVAIVPGFVNCHTHLEFSGLSTPIEPFQPFTAWIRQVMKYRRERDGAGLTAAGELHPTRIAVKQGLTESLCGGVTLLGEIATEHWDWTDYAAGPETVVFQELLGLTASRIADQQQRALAHQSSTPAGNVSAGLSPHAPYSVHPELYRHVVQRAQDCRMPVAIHLAETAAERELLSEGTGEFRDLLDELHLWQPGLFGGRSFREFLELLSEVHRGLVIHGNYLGVDDLRFLAQHPHLTLVYCPRTHAAFGHARHPWRTLLNLGGSVALGTDSRASNPDLSIWQELKFAAELAPEMSHLELLQLATYSGARALGQTAQHGSLEAGKLANLVVIGPIPDEGPELHRQLITAETSLRGVMYRGQWVVKP